jgi:hypothetical protein
LALSWLFDLGEETEERLEEDPASEVVSIESLAVVAEEVAVVAVVAGVVVGAVAAVADVDGWEDEAVAEPVPDPDADSDAEAPIVFDIENNCLERERSILGSRANADLMTWEGMGSDSRDWDWDLGTSLLSSRDFEDSLSVAALSEDVGLVAVVVVVVGASAEVASVLIDRRLLLLEALEWDRPAARVELEGDNEDVNKEEGN